ncbi:MAG: hypothetical protein K6G68_03395 [Oscillospiraceae bacterium]|nr:hypothetical protein [Oscillospiraceae bacterium]
MNFLCSCCGHRVAKEDRKERAKFISSAGIHDIGYEPGWMECEPEEMMLPVNERKWFHTDEVPVKGTKRILKVTEPFDENIGDVFTALFQPWQMALNGWDCAGSNDDIARACAVLCRFDEVLWSDDYSAFINVKILNTVPLDELYRVIPENVTGKKFYEEFGIHQSAYTEYEDEHRLYRVWSSQGDVGQIQLIYTDDHGVRHEVMSNWWSMHCNFYYFHNNVNR